MSQPTDEAVLLEGKVLAKSIQEEITAQVESLRKEGNPIPSLVAFQVGDDPSAAWYLGAQKKLANKLGLQYEIRTAETQSELLEKLWDANQDEAVHGIFITMPLPNGFDSRKVLQALDPKKDVEGIHPTSLGLIVLRQGKLIPSTAYAAFKIIEANVENLRGKKVTLVGQSAIVGRPLQLLLGERRATTIVCNTGTSEEDMARLVGEADIVVACAGQPGLVRGEWIQEGQVVVDVGTTEVEGKLTGDVEFEEARKRAAMITPVPGGVGPLTVTMLMQNLMHAYQWQLDAE